MVNRVLAAIAAAAIAFAASTAALAGSTTTTITSSRNPSTFGQTVTFRVDVAGDVSTPSGAITLKNGSTTFGSPTLARRAVTAVSMGTNHTCTILDNRRVQCTGANDSGQLGVSVATIQSTVPVLIDSAKIDNAIAIAAGASSTCAIISGGTIKCWGRNDFGQLGDGTTTSSSDPQQMPGITTATAVAIGEKHGCALLADGTARCWGDNIHAQLGTGVQTPITGLATVDIAETITQIDVGIDHSCALVSTSEVYCWGSDDLGQHGNGATSSTGPVKVPGITNATQITVGDNHSCALLSTDVVQCWGANAFGQVGNGSTSVKVESPELIPGLTGVADIAAGGVNTCARLDDGEVMCWGSNTERQIGALTRFFVVTSPEDVEGLTGTTDIGVGGPATCAIKAGQLQCWGGNGAGGVGIGFDIGVLVPTEIDVGSSATLIQANLGAAHGCAVFSNGSVRCWGVNNQGELGNGTITWSPTPVDVSNITSANSVDAGVTHTCATLTSGKVNCWGDNQSGALGNNNINIDSSTPVEVSGITTAVEVEAGSNFACARLQSGAVKCWGAGTDGQLGDGNNVNSAVPVDVTGITDARDLAVGRLHVCAALISGSVSCWGDGTASPTNVAGITDADKVAAGDYHTCARLSSDQAVCWGDGSSGQLGNNTTTSSATPVGVDSLSDIVDLAAGDGHSCARRSNGEVSCWGEGFLGRLGTGGEADALTPVGVSGISNAVSITAGGASTCAIRSSGSVTSLDCWGYRDRGMLGDGGCARCDLPMTSIANVATTTFTTSSLPGGVRTINARFSGSGALAASQVNLTQTVNKASQTVSFSPSSRLTYRADGIQLSASASSRLAVAFTSSTPTVCKVSGQKLTLVAAGTCKLTATQAGNGSYVAASRAATITVVKAATRTVLAATPAKPEAGDRLTLTATVIGEGDAAGKVVFRDGNRVIGSARLSGGRARLFVRNVEVGGHRYSASYGGSTVLTGSTSDAKRVTVAKAAARIALSASPRAVEAGGKVVLKATISAPVAASGKVVFLAGDKVIGSASIKGGKATLDFTATTEGAVVFKARYAGSAALKSATSAGVTVKVGQDASTTTLALADGGLVAAVATKTVPPTGEIRLGRASQQVAVGRLAASTIVDVASGEAHGCVLWSDGAVACRGQIGSTAFGASLEVPAGFETDVVAIAGGAAHVCALSRGGDVFCLSEAGKGDGEGAAVISGLPAPVRAIAAAADESCALGTNGEVACWQADETAATPIEGIKNASRLMVEVDRACALSGERGRCWRPGERRALPAATIIRMPAGNAAAAARLGGAASLIAEAGQRATARFAIDGGAGAAGLSATYPGAPRVEGSASPVLDRKALEAPRKTAMR